jgi:5-methylcytosine-specific restriction enzyme A
MSRSSKSKKPERFLKERGFVEAKDLPKGPNGRPLCRQCSQETEPPRKTFCSDACVHAWKVRSQGAYAREQVFERDRGVCACCGLDTETLKQLLYRVRNEKGEMAYLNLQIYYYSQTGYRFEIDKHFYEVDHVVSVADGGGSCGLENLMTLCVPCHRRKTKEWHRNRFKRRAKFGKS